MTDDLFPPAEPAMKSELRNLVQSAANDGLLVGTSSWKYEGWINRLYTPERYASRAKGREKRVAKTRFEAECLREYAEVFPTVSVDAGYYRFPDERYLAKLADAVPKGFRLSYKVTDEITIRRFPRLAKFGDRGGQPNDHFLDADLFLDAFLAKLDPHRDKTGVLMFEFSQFQRSDYREVGPFADDLHRFLAKLPTRTWQFAVELRNRDFLGPEYFAALRENNVAHVFNSWQRMPPLAEQVEIDDAWSTDFTAARLLLRPGRAYAEAVERFAPYEKLKDPYPEGRAAARKIIERERQKQKGKSDSAKEKLGQRRAGRPSYIFVNNRFEGNALETVAALLKS